MKNLKNEQEQLNKNSESSNKELKITIADYLDVYPKFDHTQYRKVPEKITLPKEFVEAYEKRILELTELSLFEKIERYVYWTNKLSSLFFKIIGALVMGNLKTTLIGWLGAILIWVGGAVQKGHNFTIQDFLTGAISAVLGTVAADAKKDEQKEGE